MPGNQPETKKILSWTRHRLGHRQVECIETRIGTIHIVSTATAKSMRVHRTRITLLEFQLTPGTTHLFQFLGMCTAFATERLRVSFEQARSSKVAGEQLEGRHLSHFRAVAPSPRFLIHLAIVHHVPPPVDQLRIRAQCHPPRNTPI